MLIITLNSKNASVDVNFPSEWEELTAAQVEAYCRYVFPYRKQVFEVVDSELYIKEFREAQFIEICRAMLFSLIGIEFKQFNKIHDQIIKKLIFEEKLLHFLFLEYNLWINPMPSIASHVERSRDTTKQKQTIYFGPINGFAQLSLSEFLDADEAYRTYLESKTNEDLVQLVAILYREQQKNYDPKSPDTTGDCREKYNDLTVQYRIEDISKVDPSILLSIFIWFESAKNIITEKYQVCFRGATGQPSDIDPILTISRSMLNYEMFKAAPAMLVLEDVKKQILEAEELKAKSKSVG